MGHDQDSVGGTFDASQAFGGELYQLNIWSKALEAGEIEDMWSGGLCRSLDPEIAEEVVIPWGHFLEADRFSYVLFYLLWRSK